jgi:hypothetical protein
VTGIPLPLISQRATIPALPSGNIQLNGANVAVTSRSGTVQITSPPTVASRHTVNFVVSTLGVSAAGTLTIIMIPNSGGQQGGGQQGGGGQQP